MRITKSVLPQHTVADLTNSQRPEKEPNALFTPVRTAVIFNCSVGRTVPRLQLLYVFKTRERRLSIDGGAEKSERRAVLSASVACTPS